jgi:hypothetical protein
MISYVSLGGLSRNRGSAFVKFPQITGRSSGI